MVNTTGRRFLSILVTLAALAMLAVALSRIARSDADVTTTRHLLGPTPVTVFEADSGLPSGSAPVVVIAHGFAGSQQLMRPFAVSLARSGYLVVTFDFYGHGRNRVPLPGDVTRVEGTTQRLIEQMQQVVDFALGQRAADDRVAVLGHSMASDVVVRYARVDPRVETTVAVSLFSPAVDADSPRNLLIINGALEGFLNKEALRILALREQDPAAERTYGRFREGTARRLVMADGVEHVGVLYSPESMHETVAWLDRAFARQGSGYADDRGGSIALLFLGIMLLGWPLSRLLPVVCDPRRGYGPTRRELMIAALLPAVATPLLLAPFPADFLSVLVGGYLAVHFGVYGLLTAVTLAWLTRRRPRSGNRPTGKFSLRRGLVATLATTAYVAGLMGWVLDQHVTSFAMTAMRWPLAATMLAGTLSYFLADEWLTRGVGAPRGAQILTRLCFLVSLGIAVALSFEDLFFLLIIAGIILVYFVVYGLFGRWVYRATGHPAVAAIANAVAFAWALAVVFPILSG